MKIPLILSVLLLATGIAQCQIKAQNIFIITTDGLRWQEVFNGADSSILSNPDFVKDTALMKRIYWSSSPEERRKKLFPFFWSVIADQGQLYGNRTLDNKVNVKNFYKISYPGYNEMFTGYADPLPMLNTPTYNRNVSVLEYLNEQPGFENKIAAFTSWNIFPFIFNHKRNKMMLNSGYEDIKGDESETATMINKVQDSILKKTHCRFDLLTFLTAKEYIEKEHPRIVYLGLGETDELGHQRRYDLYLQQATSIDKMISELWYLVQTDPFYKDNTTFIITTDHGRGSNPQNWNAHNTFAKGSGEIWIALLGRGIDAFGEMNQSQQLFQKQIAATIALLAGETFSSPHRIGEPIKLPQVTKVIAENTATGGN